jgi:hypothetical protein
MADSSLAEIFLGFGGRTGQILGTVFTGVGVLYSINRATGHAINLLQSLPQWLGMNKEVKEDDYVITRKDIFKECTNYSKLIALILSGMIIKKAGSWALESSTMNMFNSFLYGK